MIDLYCKVRCTLSSSYEAATVLLVVLPEFYLVAGWFVLFACFVSVFV